MGSYTFGKKLDAEAEGKPTRIPEAEEAKDTQQSEGAKQRFNGFAQKLFSEVASELVGFSPEEKAAFEGLFLRNLNLAFQLGYENPKVNENLRMQIMKLEHVLLYCKYELTKDFFFFPRVEKLITKIDEVL